MKSEKKFDAVKTMREVRDRLSDQFKNMSFEEQKQYIRRRVSIKSVTARNAKEGTRAA